MTREAKIGMLTGLIVIVLIGVLLSQYLGGPATTGGPTGARMAVLPIGEDYRQKVLKPVTVPTMDRPVTASGETVSIVTALGEMQPPPTAFASDPRDVPGNGPRMASPVAPVLAGPVPVEVASGGSLPTIEVHDTPVVAAQPSKPAMKEYKVKKGDTLGKIAKAFYNASKTSDLQRIVAANPGQLKDVKSPVIVDKTLLIPVLVTKTLADATPPTAPPVALKVPMPGPLTTEKLDSHPTADTKKAKTYEVKQGDSLDKIAKQISPAHAAEMKKKIMAANGIKNPDDLQAGLTLKLPA